MYKNIYDKKVWAKAVYSSRLLDCGKNKLTVIYYGLRYSNFHLVMVTEFCGA